MTVHTTGWGRLKRGIFCALAALLCVAVNANQSAEPRIERIEPLISENQLTLDLDLAFELGRVVTDAAERGVPLYFTVDLKISTPRWWWLDRVLVETTLTRRLMYNALTQQWRVATGDLFVPAGSLSEALAILKQVRAWPVAPSDRFEQNQRYDGRVRLKLDTSQLARPLQLEAANRGAWALVTPWASFDFSIQQAGSTK